MRMFTLACLWMTAACLFASLEFQFRPQEDRLFLNWPGHH